ncbi:MAG: hypothetical protein ACXADY_23965 [Candidatus Hodarchaeales archaeon]
MSKIDSKDSQMFESMTLKAIKTLQTSIDKLTGQIDELRQKLEQ